MRRRERERFDELFEGVLAALPARLHALLDECPVVLEDRPSLRLREELGMNDDDEILCGLHSGVALPARNIEHPESAEVIHIFREGVVDSAGGWDEDEDESGPFGGEVRICEEIRITLLHEIGHHFGLDEDDLERLGYA